MTNLPEGTENVELPEIKTPPMMALELMETKGLSPREIEVAHLVYRGMTNKAIAEELFISEKTAKYHCTNIYRKFKVKSRVQFVLMMVQIEKAYNG